MMSNYCNLTFELAEVLQDLEKHIKYLSDSYYLTLDCVEFLSKIQSIMNEKKMEKNEEYIKYLEYLEEDITEQENEKYIIYLGFLEEDIQYLEEDRKEYDKQIKEYDKQIKEYEQDLKYLSDYYNLGLELAEKLKVLEEHIKNLSNYYNLRLELAKDKKDSWGLWDLWYDFYIALDLDEKIFNFFSYQPIIPIPKLSLELFLQPQRLSLHLKKNKHLLKYKIFDYFSSTINNNLWDFIIIKSDYILKYNQPISKKIKLQINTETKYLLIEIEGTEIRPNYINVYILDLIFKLKSKHFKYILRTIMKEYITIIFSPNLFKEQRKYRRYLTQLKHINSEFWGISHRIISIFSVFYLFTRHIITFTFSKLLTAINRLKKDDGEIRHEIPQYWPSSKYRKKRIFEPNHSINFLLQTQFCIRQTLSNFYPSNEFSVSRIC